VARARLVSLVEDVIRVKRELERIREERAARWDVTMGEGVMGGYRPVGRNPILWRERREHF
jgi:hypothetical protein